MTVDTSMLKNLDHRKVMVFSGEFLMSQPYLWFPLLRFVRISSLKSQSPINIPLYTKSNKRVFTPYIINHLYERN